MRSPGTDRTPSLAQDVGRVGVWLGVLGWTPAVRARAAAAEIEDLGYGTLWLSEGHAGKEMLTNVGLMLAATHRIKVASGIANIWARDAVAMNAAANTLGEAYDNRFVLGLGTSHASQVDHRGHLYRKPLTAMREYLDAMDSAGYEGPRPPLPTSRVLAALRPRMLELARDRADGVHTYFMPPEHTARARAVLGPGPLLAPEQAVLLETDASTARAYGRQHMRFYLGLPNYVNCLRDLGFTDEDFADGGSDRLVDAIVAWGDVDKVRDRVQEHLAAGADHVAVQPLGDGRPIGLDQLGKLAPALLEL